MSSATNRRTPDDEPTAFQILLAEIESIPMPETSRERFFLLFRSMQGQRMFPAKRDLIGADQTDFALALLMRKRISGLNGKEIVSSFIKIAVASAVMSVICYFGYHFLHDLFGAKNLIFKFVEVFLPITFGGTAFIVVAKLLRISEIDKLFNTLKRKLGRK